MTDPWRDAFSSLLRSRKLDPARAEQGPFDSSKPNSPSPGPATRHYLEPRHATADFTEADDDDDDESQAEVEGEVRDAARSTRTARHFQDQGVHGGEGRRGSTIMLPLFSATHLDALPVYSIVHAIRIIVQTRTETTLSWDQLRSPQVSQFLVKPMQQQIRTQHFTRATLYALMANCLQFAKEGQLYPGNAGVSGTRSKVCELLAMKLLKEYNTRELIDALSYDYFPLQGLPGLANAVPKSPDGRQRTTAARSSTLEVAIRASAKHFLAHPLVVQHLEAIWNGAISFYSAADHLHRAPSTRDTGQPRTLAKGNADARTPLLTFQPVKENNASLPTHASPARRTATLYDPRNASLLKLSRLRVPRYRQFLSTCSLAILICLFLAVLIDRSSRITKLELIFWFWSAGFMLDEVVGFNEQGFSLYIMSFWNIFDLGILLLLIIYYCMRLYGMFLVDARQWNDMAYDVLASNAILLLPRIFSVLDHYQYFSQLLIAFRLMAVDLVAVTILILISCSGFFVFFTLSKNNNDAPDVAYKIFQILMGFSPAAWDVWPQYNFLGRVLLVLFLVMCHFVVVTILITVLTNSFMAIASNASQEHQFLFAINTISMVKNDALFSYVAPSNIFAWALMPLRYVMPMPQFVQLNRIVIKVTHFPILFAIFFYEKYFLSRSMYEPTDLVENQGRSRGRVISFADPASRTAVFSPNIRAREESTAGLQKDQALEEVFRWLPDANTLRHQRRQERRKTQTEIRNWMDQNTEAGPPMSNWPTMDRPAEPTRRLSIGRELAKRFRTVSDVRSTASDPADLMSNSGFAPRFFDRQINPEQQADYKDHTDADGDDELVTNDEDEDDENAADRRPSATSKTHEEDYFTTPTATRFGTLAPSSVSSIRSERKLPLSPKVGRRQGLHSRTLSTNTILYAPQNRNARTGSMSSESEHPVPASRQRPKSSRHTPEGTPADSGHRSPRKTVYNTPLVRPRPIPMKSAPDRARLLGSMDNRARKVSSIDMEINSDTGFHGDGHNDFGAVPSSFATQMAMATGQLKGMSRGTADRESADRMGRLVLARMKTLEESFADVAKEVRVLRSAAPTAHNSGNSASSSWKGYDEMEIAGADRRRVPHASSRKKNKSSSSRPTSVKENKAGLTGLTEIDTNASKGKGKEVARPAEDDEERRLRFETKGSSL